MQQEERIEVKYEKEMSDFRDKSTKIMRCNDNFNIIEIKCKYRVQDDNEYDC
jgi:hypothetical protein